jgi:hypothetical protein
MMEQILAHLLTEMNAMEERMETKIEAEIRTNQETSSEMFEVLKVLLSPRWISTKPGQRPCKKKKNGHQPEGNESWPRTPERRN